MTAARQDALGAIAAHDAVLEAERCAIAYGFLDGVLERSMISGMDPAGGVVVAQRDVVGRARRVGIGMAQPGDGPRIEVALPTGDTGDLFCLAQQRPTLAQLGDTGLERTKEPAVL